jgi:hypothetical protein
MERNATKKRDPFESCVVKYQLGDCLEHINITEALGLRNVCKFII